ncbi:hypothetical protein H6G41_25880 [Tolypothrix sp. FACHB-123]|nr:hypothetical protein [Tolypothrix sp. FACHB-123]MBD2357999.1 hypothetical protein [Tolypothrix sp. FACHB-123]
MIWAAGSAIALPNQAIAPSGNALSWLCPDLLHGYGVGGRAAASCQ